MQLFKLAFVFVFLGLTLLFGPENVNARSVDIIRDISANVNQDPHHDPTAVIKHAPFTKGGRTQYCGETAVTPEPYHSASAPFSKDCAILADKIDAVGGYFSLTPESFDTDNGWASVARVGTCTFVVQFTKNEPITDLYIGSDDIRFQTKSMLYLAKDGRLGLEAYVACNNGQANKGVSWGLRRTVEQGQPKNMAGAV